MGLFTLILLALIVLSLSGIVVYSVGAIAAGIALLVLLPMHIIDNARFEAWVEDLRRGMR